MASNKQWAGEEVSMWDNLYTIRHHPFITCCPVHPQFFSVYSSMRDKSNQPIQLYMSLLSSIRIFLTASLYTSSSCVYWTCSGPSYPRQQPCISAPRNRGSWVWHGWKLEHHLENLDICSWITWAAIAQDKSETKVIEIIHHIICKVNNKVETGAETEALKLMREASLPSQLFSNSRIQHSCSYWWYGHDW